MKKILLLLLFPLTFFGQSAATVDSLQSVLKSNVKLSEKIASYDRLLTYYSTRDEDKFLELIDELEEYPQEQCVKCQVLAERHRGNRYMHAQRLDRAISHFESAGNLADKHNLPDEFHAAKMQLIQAKILKLQLDEAEEDIKAYLANKRYTEGNANLYQAYFLLGKINLQKGFLKTSIENNLRAEELLTANKGKAAQHVGNLNNIALAYRQLGEFDKAREYVGKALDFALKSKDSLSIMNIRLAQGVLESESKNFKAAIPYLKQSLAYFEPFHAEYTGSSLLYLGIVYHNLKDYQTSQKYLDRGQEHYTKMGNKFHLAEVYGYKARNLVALKKFDEAKHFLDEIRKMLRGYENTPPYIAIMTAEMQYHEALGNHDQAMATLKQQVRLHRELETKMSKTQALELEAKYETKQQQEKIKTLSLEKAIVDNEKKTQRYLFIGIVTLLILTGITAYFLYRNKIRTAQRLKEVSEMKSRFFANISHEFRTPLTLIKSPVQQLKESGIDPEQQKQAELIDQSADRMLELVNQLIELSKLDGGALKLILKKGNPTEFLASIVEPFEFEAKNRNIAFENRIVKIDSTHEFDRDVFEKIATNLLSNAFRYHTGDAPISIETEVKDDQLTLVVANTADDLKQADLARIFERFYKKSDAPNSSGIGLALVKELVEVYQGRIYASLAGNRLSFTVELPMPQVSAGEESFMIAPTAEIPDGKPLLLIVDDNADIRSVVKSVFADHYTVIEAVDGIDALEIARREIPDAIVSDVMMPKMDGFEFATKIKSDELTSFIPVVMLTARTTDDAHLEALKHSADAFLTKPFNHDILRSTVANLLAERRKLQERYSRELVLRPVDVAVNSADEKFVLKLQTVLDLHMTNPNLSAEDFASAIGMSRMQLHRKLKALLGVSTTEFLRNERLNAAAKLLEKGNLQVSDVAYSVGFNDLSYFSKCFKERFGCTPTEFMNGKL